MSFGRWRHRVARGLGIAAVSVAFLHSQDSLRPSTAMIVRQQWGSIAEEACGKLKLPQNRSASLHVVTTWNASLAENAFLGALQKKGFETYVRKDRAATDVLVTVDVLRDDIAFLQLRNDSFARNVQLEAEVRAEYPGNEPAELLGLFKRSSRDTVAQKDESVAVGGGDSRGDADSSFFQRIAGPLVVLGSSILVVYLFFTVRS